MSIEQAEAVLDARKLLQLYEETERVEAVTQAAAALLAERPIDHVRQVACFLPPELVRVLPKQKLVSIVPLHSGERTGAQTRRG
jgi:hypothetical protein